MIAATSPSVGGVGGLAAGEGVGELGEQPGPAQAAAADDDAVAAGGGHHGHRVVGVEDVAVAEHRNALDMGFELGDLLPVGGSGVALRGCAGMQRDGRGALLGGDATGVQMGVVGVVDADPEFHRYRHVRTLGRTHRGSHDLPEQPALERQRGAAAAPGHLGHRAAEIHVDVVGEALVDDHFRRGIGVVGVDRVELQRPR